MSSIKAFLKPLFIKDSLLKLFSRGSETCISSIRNVFAFKEVVEKKNIFKARMIKKIYKAFK